MLRKNSAVLFAGICIGAAFAGPAQAEMKISTQPTQNVNCSAGVCTPTTKDAVLNVADLGSMLATGDVTVNTGGSIAKDIDIDAALSWTSTHRLTLDAYRSIAFHKPVTVTGTGALTISTSDASSGGDFRFFGKGHIEFWDTNSSLVINKQAYVLVRNIKDLKGAIHRNRNGFYALAKDNNAAQRVYSSSPIPSFGGTLEGLGNAISHFRIESQANGVRLALIGDVEGAANSAIVRDIGLTNVTIIGSGGSQCISTLAGNLGFQDKILNSYATGEVVASGAGSIAGGLLCQNSYGTVSKSYAWVTVSGGEGVKALGGLLGVNETSCTGICRGGFDQSYATGPVSGSQGAMAGGLIGYNHGGHGSNGYARGAAGVTSNAAVGGLIGASDRSVSEQADPVLTDMYSTGAVTGGTGSTVGGFVGTDLAGGISNSYWDLDTSGISDPAQGAGNVPNDPGITGLPDAELKSGLPAGFKSKIWGQNPKLNNGYPYLLALPPR